MNRGKRIRKLLFALITIAVISLKAGQILSWCHALFVTLNIIDDRKFTFVDNFYKIKMKIKLYRFRDEYIPVKIFSTKKKGKRTGILVAHGLAPSGFNDRRLVRFAKTLAKTGAVIFLPNFKLMQNVRIKHKTALKMRFIFDKMIEYPTIRKKSAGIFSISYAGGPATIAFSQSPYNKKAKFIMFLGGYYKLENVLVFGLSGVSNFYNTLFKTTPSRWGRWYYLKSNIEYINSQNDRRLLLQIADIRLSDPHKDISELENDLTQQGKSILQMIKETNPKIIKKLIRRQSDYFISTLKQMSPKNYLAGLKNVKIFLGHASNDPLIPFSESYYFRKDLIKAGGKPSFIIINVLSHVNIVNKKINLQNIVFLYLPELLKMTDFIKEIINA